MRVKISQLKNQLSKYLEAVRRGASVEVLDRNVAVARIIPVGGGASPGEADRAQAAFFEEQVHLGVIRQGTGKISTRILRGKPPGRPGVLEALVSERREGR